MSDECESCTLDPFSDLMGKFVGLLIIGLFSGCWTPPGEDSFPKKKSSLAFFNWLALDIMATFVSSIWFSLNKEEPLGSELDLSNVTASGFDLEHTMSLCLLRGFAWPESENSDVEQQNYYIKKDATYRYFAAPFFDKGGPVQKKEEITISKKSQLAVFCIHQMAIGCYDSVQIENLIKS